MLKSRIVCIAALVLAATALNANAECDPGERVIKFSHVTKASGHPKGEAATLLAQRVNAELQGRACMQVYPNSQLYNDNKVLEAILLGDVQLAAPSLSKFEKYTKQFRIFDLPFLFDDIGAVERFQNSTDGQRLLNSMRDKGLVGLGFWHNGMKQMSAKRPLVQPTDAKGLKFRIQSSEVLEAQFKQLGANPQKMAFKEVYSGLQTGVVDGQENTWSNIYTKKFFEVQDGVTETNHGILDYLVVTSAAFLDGLPTDLRADFLRIFAAVSSERNRLSTQINADNKAKILQAGGKVRTLTPAQRESWVRAMQPVWKKFERDIGAKLITAARRYNR